MGDPPPEPPELSAGTGLTLSALSKDREELATIFRVRELVGAAVSDPLISTCSMLMLGFCWRWRYIKTYAVL